MTSEPREHAEYRDASRQAPRGPAPVVAEVRPEPDPAVLAAIVSAVEECWPRPQSQPNASDPPATAMWRFSGRWWARPTAMRRERPWMGGTR